MSLHPHELDKIDWVIVVTMLYRHLYSLDDNGIKLYISQFGSRFNIYDPMNDIIQHGYTIKSQREKLNKIVKIVNEQLKNPKVVKYLRDLILEVDLGGNDYDIQTMTIRLLGDRGVGCSYNVNYYSFRYFPLKEKFERYIKELKYEPNK